MPLTPPQAAIDKAVEAARSSDCRNSRRGAAVFTPDTVLGVGCNRLPDGLECARVCVNTSCGRRAVHAEQDAILNAIANRDGNLRCLGTVDLLHVRVGDDGKPMASGRPRCGPCATLALHVNVDGVWLLHQDGWRRYGAKEFYMLSVDEPPSQWGGGS